MLLVERRLQQSNELALKDKNVPNILNRQKPILKRAKSQVAGEPLFAVNGVAPLPKATGVLPNVL